jgi:hypothetical protein
MIARTLELDREYLLLGTALLLYSTLASKFVRFHALAAHSWMDLVNPAWEMQDSLASDFALPHSSASTFRKPVGSHHP